MATESQILERQKEVSDRISTQVRTLAVSFLALVWLFLVPGQDGAPRLPNEINVTLLMVSGAAAVGSLIFDFLQYLASYLTVREALSAKPDDAPDDYEYGYDYDSFSYRVQSVFFWLKQVALAISFAFLVIAFWKAFFG